MQLIRKILAEAKLWTLAALEVTQLKIIIVFLLCVILGIIGQELFATAGVLIGLSIAGALGIILFRVAKHSSNGSGSSSTG